jgi:Sulfatase
MTLLLLWLLLFGGVVLTERRADRMAFAVVSLVGVAATLLLLVADLERATLLAAVLAVAIMAASRVKYHHSGSKLTVSDFALAFAGTLPFLWAQYTSVAIVVLTVAGGLILAALWIILRCAGSPLAFEQRFALFAFALVASVFAYRICGGAAVFRPIVTQRLGYVSTFMASLIDTPSWRPTRGLSLIDLAQEPLPLLAATSAQSASRPDIIFIQHESIFDPRTYGLAVDPTIEAFLSPVHGVSGGLNVDIYGGGSWQSEFSLLTGLSSAIFGPDAYFIFSKGVDRFQHSLPGELAALGYKTMLMSSCRRGFMGYDAFYRSIGFEERLFSDDLPPPFDVNQFEVTNSDAVFLEAAIGAFAARLTDDPTPRFLYALTNFNHGPHDRRRVLPGHFEAERAFALANLPDAQYAEYYSRLAETAASWQQAKTRLSQLFPHRPMLIVHYGDHQPVMTRRLERQLALNEARQLALNEARLTLPEDVRRQFRTFYAIEGLNFQMAPADGTHSGTLDIAFLGTVAMQRAGLPLDQVSATRASLIDDCGEAYFASRSERKGRFHRTLVDLGLIDVAAKARKRS